MKGFIVHPTYKIEGDKTFVHLFGRLENGESFLIINEYKPYFYIRKKDLQKVIGMGQEVKFEYEKGDFRTVDGDSAIKLVVNTPKDVPKLRRELEGIHTFESDIRFPYRYMFDQDIKGIIEFEEGAFKKGIFVDRIYENIEVKGGEQYDVKLKTLSIDIETDMKADNIFAISFWCDGFKKSMIISDNTSLKDAVCFPSEKELLINFKEKIWEIDPDIITGWNVIDFDLKVLQERFRHYNIPFNIGRIDFEVRITSYDDFFRESSASVAGRMVLDGISLLKNNFIKLQDYKLHTAAMTFLKEGKLIESDSRFDEIQRLYAEDQQKLVDYNLKDAELVMRILEAKNLISITITRSLITGMQMDRVDASIASLDSLYLRETRKKGIVCQSMVTSDSDERIKGGYVMDPESGIYDYVIVLDFKSLYPSIIRTFNIDPLTFSADGPIVAPNDAHFDAEDGIMPMLIKRLWAQRDIAKKQKDDVASYAIKVTMNSFFGVLANPMCRFYNLDVANAITSFGRYIIKETSKILQKRGHKVIYGDTDSIFIDAKAKSLEEADKIGVDIQKHINAYFDEYVKTEFKRESFLELEYEKVFVRFILPKVRHGEGGAKKRYAGLVIKDGKEEIKFTGLEFVRRDWTKLAKKFQLELLDKVFHKQEVAEYVKDFIAGLKDGKFDDLLIYVKALRKPISEYTRTTPPHVKAAMKMKKVESRIIKYYMTIDGPEPEENRKNDIDYDHYIQKQLKPIADSILVFFDISFDDLETGSTQKTLFGY